MCPNCGGSKSLSVNCTHVFHGDELIVALRQFASMDLNRRAIKRIEALTEIVNRVERGNPIAMHEFPKARRAGLDK